MIFLFFLNVQNLTLLIRDSWLHLVTPVLNNYEFAIYWPIPFISFYFPNRLSANRNRDFVNLVALHIPALVRESIGLSHTKTFSTIQRIFRQNFHFVIFKLEKGNIVLAICDLSWFKIHDWRPRVLLHETGSLSSLRNKLLRSSFVPSCNCYFFNEIYLWFMQWFFT